MNRRMMMAYILGQNASPTYKRCVVSNLGSQNPSDVTFAKSSTFPTEQNAYEEVTINGNVFAKFTTWYRKSIYSNGELTGFIISDTQEDSSFVPYDCFLDESGNVLPYILIGKYCLSSTSVANSVDATPASMTIGAGRSLCQALGTGYQVMDYAMYNFWRDLALAISETVNFECGDIYLGLKLSAWVLDGIGRSNEYINEYILYSNKPSKYVDSPTSNTDGYSALSYAMTTTNDYCISKLGYDSNFPLVNIASASVSNSAYDTYYCDGIKYSSGSGAKTPIYVQPQQNTFFKTYGLFFVGSNTYWTSGHQVRLSYRPIS